MSIYQRLADLEARGINCALVTVIKTEGSTPRAIGSKMIVEASGSIHGTIGGSQVESLVIAEALQSLDKGLPKIIHHDLYDETAQDTGMICGGTMEFFIEPVLSADRVFIFGAGHVALHTASILREVGFEYVIIDERAEFANSGRFPDARQIIVRDPSETARELELRSADYVVIVTHGHKHDYLVLREVIKKPCRYIGMIASKVKRNEIFEKLRSADGITEDELNRVYSPIGLDIHAETPEEIAVSIAAEIIKVKRSS